MGRQRKARAGMCMGYSHERLCGTGGVVQLFIFARGLASGPAGAESVMLGHAGLGIADRNTVAGVVRAFAALRDLRENESETIQARAKAFKLVTGARLVFCDGTPDIVVYPRNRAGWGQLCRLLTLGNRREVKGECELRFSDLLSSLSSPSPLWGGPGWGSGGGSEFQSAKTGESGATPTLTLPTRGRGKEGKDNLLLIIMPPQKLAGLDKVCAQLSRVASGCVWLAASMLRKGSDKKRLAELKMLAQATQVPLIATNDVLYTDQSQRDLQDILTCIREGVTVQEAGRILEANAERHLKTPQEMARLFADCARGHCGNAESSQQDRVFS